MSRQTIYQCTLYSFMYLYLYLVVFILIVVFINVPGESCATPIIAGEVGAIAGEHQVPDASQTVDSLRLTSRYDSHIDRYIG